MDQKFILIVDDDELITTSLTGLLKSDAVTIRTAATREEAEMLIEAESFDLAIIDLHLTERPGQEGLELISRIKQQTPETHVVLFTAYGSPEIEHRARQRGAADYWEKTIEIPALLERVRALGIPLGPVPRQDWYSTQANQPGGQN
jgi:DNA-binding NtrC family response regulator